MVLTREKKDIESKWCENIDISVMMVHCVQTGQPPQYSLYSDQSQYRIYYAGWPALYTTDSLPSFNTPPCSCCLGVVIQQDTPVWSPRIRYVQIHCRVRVYSSPWPTTPGGSRQREERQQEEMLWEYWYFSDDSPLCTKQVSLHSIFCAILRQSRWSLLYVVYWL